VIIVAGGKSDARREVLGMGIVGGRDLLDGFLRELPRGSLRGFNLSISDCHEGIKIAKVLHAFSHLCRSASCTMR
jgi:hypothetical protein